MTDAQEQQPTGSEPAEVEVLDASVVLTHRRTPTQAERYATRRAAKEQAAPRMKANEQAAQKAKRKAQAKAPAQAGVAEFQKRAKAIEADMGSRHVARQAEGTN